MIGLLIVTHAPLGAAFLQVLTHVLGKLPPMIDVVDIATGESRESAEARILTAVPRLNDGEGVLLMSDIVGATPANCSQRLMIALTAIAPATIAPATIAPITIACLSGINLPMLLRAIYYRHQALEQLVDTVIEGGHLGMIKL